jgi:hypothetical protein
VKGQKPLHAQGNQTFSYRAKAFDLESGRFIYTENHREIWQNGRHVGSAVRYLDPYGKLLVSKTVNYRTGETTPTFEMVDSRDGYTEAANVNGRSVVLKSRRNSNQPMASESLQLPAQAVIDSGFDAFVRSRLDDLMQGKSVKFPFAVPVERKFFEFRLRKTSASSGKVKFTLELDNMVFRLFVKPIDLTYHRESRRLLEYRGMSNINNADGKSYRARIVFEYPEELLSSRLATNDSRKP